MKETFWDIGSHTWGVTDDRFLYGRLEFPYGELDYIRIVNMGGIIAGGTLNFSVKGKMYACTFRYVDYQRAMKAVRYASEKMEEAKGIVKNYKYCLWAHTGTKLEVYDDYLIIYFMPSGTVANLARGGGLGGKRIDFTDITSVQFREVTTAVGFIQFSYPGSVESKGGVGDALNDENTIPFRNDQEKEAKEIYDYIIARRAELKKAPAQATVVQQTSPVDEIRKYKALLDEGIISQDEFDTKKKQLLGL